MHCLFCQNHRISQNTDINGEFLKPAEIIMAAKKYGQIAYTYSEPLVHIEFLLDCMKLAKKEKIKNVLVTNGCVNPVPAAVILNS
jgi:pyruvate formate lyase activating enzyme